MYQVYWYVHYLSILGRSILQLNKGTSASVLIRRVFASAPQDVQLNLATILLRVFIFAESLATWYLERVSSV